MVLWDSRTVHDNAEPIRGRTHSDRWRFIILVCMAPAIWASENDIRLKNKAFKEMLGCAHWPSQGVKLFTDAGEPEKFIIQRQPDVANSSEVRRLVGLDKYDFNDGESNGPGWVPEWSKESETDWKWRRN